MQYQITDIYETRAGISVVLSCDDGDEAEKTLLFKPSLWLEEGLQAGDIVDEEGIELSFARRLRGRKDFLQTPITVVPD